MCDNVRYAMMALSPEHPHSDLLLANAEALSKGETVAIPCSPLKDETCTFDVVNAEGQTGTMVIGGHIKK